MGDRLKNFVRRSGSHFCGKNFVGTENRDWFEDLEGIVILCVFRVRDILRGTCADAGGDEMILFEYHLLLTLLHGYIYTIHLGVTYGVLRKGGGQRKSCDCHGIDNECITRVDPRC